MCVKFEGIQQLPLENNKKDNSLADCLMKLIKIDFYPEKYVWVFEDYFNLDNVEDIMKSYDVLTKLE